MQSPSEIFSQINSFFTGKIRRKSSDSLTSPSPEDEDEDEDEETSSEDSDHPATEAIRSSPRKTGKYRRYSETTNCYRKQRGYKATVTRHSQTAVNFMRMAKQDIKLNLKRLSFGDNTPPALPARHFSIDTDDELPPPIPERKCSLEGFLDVEFERRFTFRPMSTCRLPEPFTDCKKTYPSAQPRRKAVQRPVVQPPPPPPPQDTSLSSPDSPGAIFSLSSPPFKQGVGGIGGGVVAGGAGGIRKTSAHQLRNNNNNNNRGNKNNNNRFSMTDDLPLPPPPPDPLTKLRNGNQNGAGGSGPTNRASSCTPHDVINDTSGLYSKAQKTKSKLESLFHSRQSSSLVEESDDLVGKLNGSQNNVNGEEEKMPPLPPSLIPPPPSKPLPPPPLSAKPNLLTRTNSNSRQQIVPTSSGEASPRGMRISMSTPLFSSSSPSSHSDADNRKSLMLDVSNGRNNSKSSPRTQRSVSTTSLPPPLPSRNSMMSTSPSLKPKPGAIFENGTGTKNHTTHDSEPFNQKLQSKSNGLKPHTHGLNPLAQQSQNNTTRSSSKNDHLLHVDVGSIGSSPRTSPSNSSRQSSPSGNPRPLLPPKKDGLISNNHNNNTNTNTNSSSSSSSPHHQSSSGSSTGPFSSVFHPPAFSSHPLPKPPPSPTSTTTTSTPPPPPPPLPPPPPFSASSSPSSSPSSLSILSSSSSLSSHRKLSGNKNRPLPPPPQGEGEGASHPGNNRKSGVQEPDYGEGWGGKEAFDPREEDGDIYDLMDSTNM